MGLMDDLDVVRYTNNKVYDDIAWVHFAYTTPGGGIALIKNLLQDDAENSLLLEGFMNIERGRLLLEFDKQQAEQYIWYGNTLLLKHEQVFTVQPMFKKLDFSFRKFLALSTAMDFDGRHLKMDRKTYTSFYMYMWLRGIKLLFKTRSLPSLINFEHRWAWINKRILEIWKKVDATDESLKKKIALFMEFETSSDSRP